MHVNTFVISFYTIFLRDLFINFDRYYYKPATTVFILQNVWFLVPIRVVQIKLSLGIQFIHVNTFVITFYNIFLRDLFINFNRYYYKPAITVLYSKMSCFSADSSCTDKIESMYLIYTCKHIRYNQGW